MIVKRWVAMPEAGCYGTVLEMSESRDRSSRTPVSTALLPEVLVAIITESIQFLSAIEIIDSSQLSAVCGQAGQWTCLERTKRVGIPLGMEDGCHSARTNILLYELLKVLAPVQPMINHILNCHRVDSNGT